MGIVRDPRKPLEPKDVIKRIPQSPSDISISVSVPTANVTNKGRVVQRPIKLWPRTKG